MYILSEPGKSKMEILLMKIRLLRILGLGLVCSCALFAQGVSTIVGTVTDPSGASVPAATVRVKQVGTGQERATTTNAQGYFVIPSLPPSNYQLEIEAAGFQSFSQKNITLQADESLTVNAALKVGTFTQTVVVDATPPAVNTTTGTLGGVVDTKRMVELPLNGRNAASLVLLVGGTVLPPNNQGVDQGNTKTFPAGIPVAVNGTRQDEVSYQLDGANNRDIYTNINAPFPFPDALQEFSVQTSNYSAKYGQNAGGAVNIVTKSGTNQLHGNIFEFNRNAVFNARNFFAATRDQLKRNQYGGTLGGPIRRDKTFFFAGFQGTLIRNVSTANSAYVPTPAELTGDFSALLNANDPANPQHKATIINDPKTGQPFPGNLIPAARLDPASLALAKLLPQAGGTGLVFYPSPTAQNFNEVLGRVDHSLSGKDHMVARWYFDRYTQPSTLTPSNYLTYWDSSDIRAQNALLGETHIFSPGLLNEGRVSYHRETASRLPPPGAPEMRSLGVNIYDAGSPGIQSVNVTGFFNLGSDPPALFIRNSFTFGDDMHWVHGRHSVSFGASVDRSRQDIANQNGLPGTYTFNATNTNYALASYMLGYLNTFTQGSGQYKGVRDTYAGFYIQDDFHATRRLTLNFGLRYEPFFPWTEIHGYFEFFSPSAYHAGTKSRVYTNAPPGLFFPGDPGVPTSEMAGDFDNVAPRFGFAWDVFGDGTTSVRGGAGIFHNTRVPAGLTNSAQFTPFNASVSLTQPAGPFSNPYLGITNPFPLPRPLPANSPFPTPVGVASFDPINQFKVASIYSYNLTLERQLAPEWLLRAGFVGSHGSHLNKSIQLNPAVYIPGSKLGTDARRLFQPFSSIGVNSQAVNSSYNSLQLGLEKRLSRGFTIRANYTYSKSIDDMPYNHSLIAIASPTSVLPWYFPNSDMMDRGPSDFDRTHNFVASYVWNLPALRGAARLLRGAFGGWELTGIASASTGVPLTIMAGKDQSQTGLSRDRGIQAGSAYGAGACGVTAPCVNYLIPTSFTLPATGTFGTIGKGSLRGPGVFNWDMGLFKSFPIRERYRIQLRGEFFNIFNRTNLLDPSNSISAAAFGSITSARDPRISQLAMKFVF